jgi:putative ABC transport system permease protein
MNDLKHALRSLSKSPAFSGVIIAMIAFAIGANSAIFSVLQAVVLRPLPFADPERLVRVYETLNAPGTDVSRSSMSAVTWARWRGANDVFTDIARANFGSRTLTRDGAEAQRLVATQVSANFFGVLGIAPVLGRDFRAEDDMHGAEPVVIVGDGFWRNNMGARPDAIGTTITLDGRLHTVIGVMAPRFRHPYRTDIWVPFAEAIDFSQIGVRGFYAPARLKPGVTIAGAEASLRELCTRINSEFVLPNAATGAAVLPLQSIFVADLKPKLFAITVAAAFVLLIAGANIASLLLARHIEREGDSSIRVALGASRRALVRESLAQSVLLAAFGTALGVVLAMWMIDPLVALSPLGSDASGGVLRELDVPISVNTAVLAFSIGAALLLALGFGLLPAFRNARAEVGTALKGVGRSGTLDAGSRRWLRLIVVGEVAVAVVLLVSTALMIRSFGNLIDENWGYAIENRLAADVTFTDRLRPDHADRVRYVEQGLERLRVLPGVQSAYATTPHQMYPAFSLAAITPEGTSPPEPRGYYLAYHRMVFPGYFRDSGVPITRGRAIDETDRVDGQRVAVVSEGLAMRMWPGQDPIGKTIKRGRATDTRPPYVVVGVAADRKAIIDRDDGDVIGQWYVPYVQNPNYLADTVTFVLAANVAPESLESQARAALAAVDPGIAASNFNTLERLVDASYANDRFAVLLIGMFGVLGLLMAALGLYALLAFQVACRTREIGVRTALGASARDIVAMVLREGGVLLLAGMAAGIGASLTLTRLLNAELHNVSATDPYAYLAAALVLGPVAALACWLPARRAAQVDPMVALRAE